MNILAQVEAARADFAESEAAAAGGAGVSAMLQRERAERAQVVLTYGVACWACATQTEVPTAVADSLAHARQVLRLGVSDVARDVETIRTHWADKAELARASAALEGQPSAESLKRRELGLAYLGRCAAGAISAQVAAVTTLREALAPQTRHVAALRSKVQSAPANYPHLLGPAVIEAAGEFYRE